MNNKIIDFRTGYSVLYQSISFGQEILTYIKANLGLYNNLIEKINRKGMTEQFRRYSGTPIFYSRLNDKQRIFYLLLIPPNSSCLDLIFFPLSILEDHNYARLSSSLNTKAKELLNYLKLLPAEEYKREEILLEEEANLSSTGHSSHVSRIEWDQSQRGALSQTLPFILTGPAGSGKTLVAGEYFLKPQILPLKRLYVSHSKSLVEKVKQIYVSSLNQQSLIKNIDFLCYRELELRYFLPPQPANSPVLKFRNFEHFATFYQNNPQLKRNLDFLNCDLRWVFNEINGIILGTSLNGPYLSRKDYLALGLMESFFPKEQRSFVYNIFEQYEKHKSSNLYDSLTLARHSLSKKWAAYEMIVVDEIQDFTLLQVMAILNLLDEKNRGNFILAGDALQSIASDSAFRWSRLKSSLGYQGNLPIIQLTHNHRQENKAILWLSEKVLRFQKITIGSLDKESNYPENIREKPESFARDLILTKARKNLLDQILRVVGNSINYAILVPNEWIKEALLQEAQSKGIKQPLLVFTPLEAKGLEFETVFLFKFLETYHQPLTEACNLFRSKPDSQNKLYQLDSLPYARTADKEQGNKPLLRYALSILYTVITRSTHCLAWIEEEQWVSHPLLQILGLVVNHHDMGSLPANLKPNDDPETTRNLIKSLFYSSVEANRELAVKLFHVNPRLFDQNDRFFEEISTWRPNIPSLSLTASTSTATYIFTGSVEMDSSSGKGSVTLKSPQKGRSANSKPQEISFISDKTLISAVKKNDIQACKYLIEAKADLSQERENGLTLLIEACVAGHTEIVQLLIRKKADINQSAGKVGTTALFEACLSEREAIVKILIDKKASINQTIKDGRTALFAAAEKSNVELCQLLVQAKADINHRDNLGFSAENPKAFFLKFNKKREEILKYFENHPHRAHIDLGHPPFVFECLRYFCFFVFIIITVGYFIYGNFGILL